MQKNTKKVWFFLFLVFSFAACKVEKPTVNLSYSENLGKYRLRYADTVLKVIEMPIVPESKLVPVAQNTEKSLSKKADLERVLEKIAETNKKIKATVGYRVQVYSASDRMEAYSFIEKVRKLLPDEKIELEYQAPSYKVKIGNYLRRVEAYHTFTLLKEEFPEAVILNDKVAIDLEKYHQKD